MGKDAQSETNQNVSMKVWRPDDTIIKVSSIASQESHIGNLIAEGYMSKDEYYPALVAYYKRRSRTAEQTIYSKRTAAENAKYRRNWVQRWLLQTALIETHFPQGTQP